MTDEAPGFDISRAPDLSMALGIACVAIYLLGCCIGLGLGGRGCGPLACCAWPLGGGVGSVGRVRGRTGTAKIDAGELDESLRGRAKTGSTLNIAGLALMALTMLAGVALMVLGMGAIFMIPIIDSM